MLRLLRLLAVCMAICGCARIYTTRQVFHRLPATGAREAKAETYAFVPLAEQDGNLEYATYQDLMRIGLSRYGWTEVPFQEASAAIAFQYYIDDGKAHSLSLPVWGQTGVSGATTTTFGNYSTTTYTPSYGVTGYRQESETVFTRRLDVIIADAKQLSAGKVVPVYQATAVSRGSTGVISPVMPYLFRTVFEDFPGPSGKSDDYTYYWHN